MCYTVETEEAQILFGEIVQFFRSKRKRGQLVYWLDFNEEIC